MKTVNISKICTAILKTKHCQWRYSIHQASSTASILMMLCSCCKDERYAEKPGRSAGFLADVSWAGVGGVEGVGRVGVG